MEENYRRLQAAVNRYMQDSDVRPSEARSKIIGELNGSIKKCLDLEISSVGNVEAGQGTLFFKKTGHPKEFEFNVLSSGEKEVIDLLLDLYLRKDDYGKVVTEKDRRIYLQTNPENHRVMKRFELENYLYDKEVLKAYCIGNDLTFDEVSYDTFVTNIVDQNLKDETARIKSICGIKSSVNSESFKIALANYLTADISAFAELRDCIFARA